MRPAISRQAISRPAELRAFALDFSSSAAGPVPAGLQREYKLCEMCPRYFLRVRPLVQRMGQKVCERCIGSKPP